MSRRSFTAYLLGAFTAMLVIFAMRTGFFEAAESRFVDWKFRLRPQEDELDPNVALIEVTDDCLRKLGDMPWPRSRWARLVDATRAAGAKVVGIDVLFDEPSKDPSEDLALARSLSAAGNVYLAAEVRTRVEFDSETGELRKVVYLRRPMSVLDGSARGTGIVNIDFIYDNVDGILRVMPLAQRLAGKLTPTLALATAAEYLDLEPSFDSGGSLILGTYHVPPARAVLKRDIERLEGENILRARAEASAYVNYHALTSRGLFTILSASGVLGIVDALSEAQKRPASDPARAVEIARATRGLDQLRGKVVLMGVNATGIDMKNVPYGTMAGVQAQANVVRNLLNHEFLVRQSGWAQTLGLVAAGLILPLIFLRLGLVSSLVLMLGGAAALIGSSVLLFSRSGYLLDVYPGTALATGQFVLMKLYLLAVDLRRRIRSLEHLTFYSRRFNSTLHLEELRVIIQDSYATQTGADASALVLTGDKPEEMEIYGGSAALPEGFAEWALSTELKKALLSRWASKPGPVTLAELPGELILPDGYAAEELVAVPLLNREAPDGWIVLMGRGLDAGVTSAEEQTFWATLSGIAYTALQNARHYQLATIDGLTSLTVRHIFDLEIEKEFSRASRYGGRLSLLLTDIDHFKSFNDTYGHQLGDRVLRMVADQVKRSIRQSDTAARYGGEEFVVILPETDPEGANLLAERIRSRIEEMRIPHDGKELEVTISIGLASMGQSRAKNAKGFIAEADTALYAAKEGGRNQVRSFGIDDELLQMSASRHSPRPMLEKLARGE